MLSQSTYRNITTVHTEIHGCNKSSQAESPVIV